MASLLVVDDEQNVLYSLAKSLQSETLDVIAVSTGREGIEQAERQRPDAVILDLRLSDMSGMDVFDRLRAIDPRLPIVLITAFATTETAIEATKRGAFEYLLKPIDFHQLREVVQRALELSRFRHVPAVFDEAGAAETSDRIVGRSAVMQEVYKAIGRVASQDVTVLITGENGTGKELVARALYHHGTTRSGGPFVVVNCAAIPDTLLESELFGHERGAFTGAERRRIGKFEQAHGGTLFLDEIGDMSPATQSRVLRVLQEQRFERLGGNETIATDVRLIAASNKDLEKEVAAGRFRRDLFYRLGGFAIHLPPLRDRRDDLPLLIEHFLRLYGRGPRRTIRSVAPEALRCLQEHDWPGNVRELQNAIHYAVIRAPGEVLTLDCLPETLRSAATPAPAAPAVGSLDVARLTADLLRAGEPDLYRRVCLAVDRVVVETVLRHVKGNQVQASELLGISRTTLRAKLRALGITVEKSLMPESNPRE